MFPRNTNDDKHAAQPSNRPMDVECRLDSRLRYDDATDRSPPQLRREVREEGECLNTADEMFDKLAASRNPPNYRDTEEKRWQSGANTVVDERKGFSLKLSYEDEIAFIKSPHY